MNDYREDMAAWVLDELGEGDDDEITKLTKMMLLPNYYHDDVKIRIK